MLLVSLLYHEEALLSSMIAARIVEAVRIFPDISLFYELFTAGIAYYLRYPLRLWTKASHGPSGLGLKLLT
jgi:hypothetical protein